MRSYDDPYACLPTSWVPCVTCQERCSGMGRCDTCGEALCFLCANFPEGMFGRPVYCDPCLEVARGNSNQGVSLQGTEVK